MPASLPTVPSHLGCQTEVAELKGEYMATLTVLKFDGADKAEQALESLQELRTQHVLSIADAAVVSWPEGRRAPVTRQAVNTAGVGALGGTFWGMLVGFLFMMPLLGAVIGAAAGAISGALTDIGINDNFIRQVRDQVQPGTSALFLLSATEAPDRVAEQLNRFSPSLFSTNLSREQEEKLRELFEGS